MQKCINFKMFSSMKKMTFSIFYIFILLSFNKALGQTIVSGYPQPIREKYFSQYYFQQVLYNPAYAGEDSQPRFSIFGNRQTFSNNTYEQPIAAQLIWQGQLEGVGGLAFTAAYQDFDNYYPCFSSQCESNERIMRLGAAYNYKWQPNDDMAFRVGINGGIMHFNSEIPPYANPFNPQAALVMYVPFVKANIDIGLLYRWRDLRAGVGFVHINTPNFQFFQPDNQRGNFRPEVYVTLSYNARIGEHFGIQPNIMMNQQMGSMYYYGSSLRQIYFDASLLLNYQQIVFSGASYKRDGNLNRWSFMAAGRLNNKYQLSLSYDVGGATRRIEAGFSLFIAEESE